MTRRIADELAIYLKLAGSQIIVYVLCLLLIQLGISALSSPKPSLRLEHTLTAVLVLELLAGISSFFSSILVGLWLFVNRKRTVSRHQTFIGLCLLVLLSVVEPIVFVFGSSSLAFVSSILPSTQQRPSEGQQLLGEHPGYVEWVAFSPDGRLLASVSGNIDSGEVRVWDIKARKLKMSQPLSGMLTMATFSPDGETIAIGTGEARSGKVLLWHYQTNQMKSLDDHTSLVRRLAFLPNGKDLISASYDLIGTKVIGKLNHWDVKNGHLEKNWSAHDEEIWALAISADGTLLASAGDDKQLKIWDLQDWRLIRTLITNNMLRSIAFSPNGLLLAGADGNEVKCWMTHTGKLKWKARMLSHVQQIAFSPDGRLLAVALGLSSNSIVFLDTLRGKKKRELHGHSEAVVSIAFSPNGKTIASGGGDKTVRLWQVR